MPPLLMLKPNEPRLCRIGAQVCAMMAQLKGPKVKYFIVRAISGDHQLVATLLSACVVAHAGEPRREEAMAQV